MGSAVLGRGVEVVVGWGGGSAVAAAGPDSSGGEPADSAPAEQKGQIISRQLIRAEKTLACASVSHRKICRIYLSSLRLISWITKKLGTCSKHAPCCSSRVMDPSCLFTTDEGESGTQIRWTIRLQHRGDRGLTQPRCIKANSFTQVKENYQKNKAKLSE